MAGENRKGVAAVRVTLVCEGVDEDVVTIPDFDCHVC